MFRFLRFIISCVVLSVIIWFCVSVPLGKHTLWEHVMRIAKTSEAQDLAEGARDKAKDIAQRVQKISPPPKEPPKP